MPEPEPRSPSGRDPDRPAPAVGVYDRPASADRRGRRIGIAVVLAAVIAAAVAAGVWLFAPG